MSNPSRLVAGTSRFCGCFKSGIDASPLFAFVSTSGTRRKHTDAILLAGGGVPLSVLSPTVSVQEVM